jgi:hypothetical protein
MAKHGLQGLTPEEFDRTTGAIVWPRLLEQPKFDEFRKQYDEFFQKWASNGAMGSDDYMTIMAASKQWRNMLAAEQGNYPPNILSQMTRFVLKLDRVVNDYLG